mmetsp:Transcript_43364/g.85924  ORF Transcript_43364/g.85924 Transcript_43364/m.85924 type:complete len:345 (-) Transcript_43364:213-1247(-)
MGSLSGATSFLIFASRIMKLVAHVSSSIKSVVAPASKLSMMLPACDVDPDASAVEKHVVVLPKGKLLMKGEMSTDLMDRPSSALILTAPGSHTTSSRPSPGTLLYMPTCNACRSVLFPWKPPPTIREIPRRIPMPCTTPACGSVIVTSSDAGLWNNTRLGESCRVIGLSSTPLLRGNTAPLPTNATRLKDASCWRKACWSSTDSTCCRSAFESNAEKKSDFSTASHNPPTMSAARYPSTLRPLAGRASVTRASTNSALATTLVRSITYCPGVSICKSPPLLLLQLPPETACVQSVPPPPRKRSDNTRVTKSHSAVLATLESVTQAFGKPAARIGTRTRTQEGGA